MPKPDSARMFVCKRDVYVDSLYLHSSDFHDHTRRLSLSVARQEAGKGPRWLAESNAARATEVGRSEMDYEVALIDRSNEVQY